ncbi:MAG TPA: hypothetical protein DDX54_01290 [Rhodospirillaceae bacterium]|nr:two pore domain potassium channel family protein [Alphaproteobacteria bacterium]HBH26029.1 hypothetical protein [Rhodospirillaceae bacterium]
MSSSGLWWPLCGLPCGGGGQGRSSGLSPFVGLPHRGLCFQRRPPLGRTGRCGGNRCRVDCRAPWDSGALSLPSVVSDYASVDLIYFSFATLTTLGFGDIAPVSPPARILSVAEAGVGVLYTTILVARLVALYGARTR